MGARQSQQMPPPVEEIERNEDDTHFEIPEAKPHIGGAKKTSKQRKSHRHRKARKQTRRNR